MLEIDFFELLPHRKRRDQRTALASRFHLVRQQPDEMAEIE